MALTDDLARLVDLAQRNEWRLVAVGDPAQLPAIGRGGAFAHWCQTVPHIELETPRRFQHGWEAEASLLLRAGDPRAAKRYAEHNRLRTVHPAMLPLDVARAHQRHVAAGRSVAITTNTAETARAINLAIQRARPGEIGAPLADGTTAQVGDQIATRRNDPSLRTDRDDKIRNRHTWTVTAIDEDGSLTVSHPERGEVVLPARYDALDSAEGTVRSLTSQGIQALRDGLQIEEPAKDRR